jgi:hypothetical protein
LQLAHSLGSLVDAEDDVFQAGVQMAIRAFEKSATLDPQNSVAWIEMARLEACNGVVVWMSLARCFIPCYFSL